MSDLINPAEVGGLKYVAPVVSDPWLTARIPTLDFAGKVLATSSPAERFGMFSDDAHIVVRLQRIVDMSEYVVTLPDGPRIYVEQQTTMIKAMAKALGGASPSQAADLRAKYDATVVSFEHYLETVIRARISNDKLAYERLVSSGNFKVGGGDLQQQSRRPQAQAEVWSAENFIARLKARGVWVERDDETGGVTYRGGGALSAADYEAIMQHREVIEVFLAGRRDLCGPPPPPPPLPAPVADEPLATAAPPPPPPAPPPAAAIEPDEEEMAIAPVLTRRAASALVRGAGSNGD